MISGRISAERAFGPAYKGFYRKIPPCFSMIKAIIEKLSVARSAFSGPNPLYNAILLELLDAFKSLDTNPIAIEKSKQALSGAAASPSTVTFIMHYFKRAAKEGLDEIEAIKNVVDNLPAILASTAYIPYPSSEGQNLIQGMRNSPQENWGRIAAAALPGLPRQEVEKAAADGFNPMAILGGETASYNGPTNTELHAYLSLSKQALLSFAHSLVASSSPNPLWVFLMRDAHLLYLASQHELPGETMEVDVGKISLASSAEKAAIFDARGYNIGWAKTNPPIEGYSRLIQELGDNSEDGTTTIRPKEIIPELIQGERKGNDLAEAYQKFRRAQQVLAGLAVPEQIDAILETAGITEAGASGRPVVFIDTGFRGSLPLLLQNALSRSLTRRGCKPNVHTWLDYVVEPFDRLVNAHQSGPWRVSPLDGLVSLNRILVPKLGGLSTEIFTTPFDAMRQARVIAPYDQYEGTRLAA